MFKSGFVSIVGRPNVGKSTLLNSILETKLAIMSDVAQTTRNTIQGIHTDDEAQIIFMDTPGIHKPQDRLGTFMNTTALNSIFGVDLVLFLAPANEKIGRGDKFIIERLKEADGPVFLVLSKIDTVSKEELIKMAENLEIFGEILVYGATIIHQSKRPLLENYYNFIKTDEEKSKARNLFLSEPKDETTHYSIYEDSHGTHIFASDDVDMMTELATLSDLNYTHWKLDGIYTPGDTFVKIAERFVQARKLLEAGELTPIQAFALDEEIRSLHPAGRTLGHGFYDLEPDDIQ